jgi:tetratricopeptide (TPR) repeat protein
MPFTEATQGFFHGRDAEAAELFRRVRHDHLTILFGQSGLGKTSQLSAGLFPRLRSDDFLPVYIRLDLTNPQLTPVEQIKTALAENLAAYGIEGRPPVGDETLWAYFHGKDTEFWSRRNRIVTPALVLDQFEEIFTLGHRAASADALVDELAALIENRPPESVGAALEDSPEMAGRYDFAKQGCKLILALREDFLPDLESLRRRMPSIMDNRMRLTRMDGQQARDVILGSGGRLVAPGVAQKVIAFVAARRGEAPERRVSEAELAGFEIEPALLSIVCRELAIRTALAARDPTNDSRRSELSLSHRHVGDVLRSQGEVARALMEFQADLAIAQSVAAKDPRNIDRQHSLGIAHNRVGLMLQAQGDLTSALREFRADLAITAVLAEKKPANTNWQVDLAISHNLMGQVLQAQHDLAGALAEFRAEQEVRARLAAKEPTNARRQADLVASHENVGDVLEVLGDLAGALKEFQAQLAITTELAAKDPANADWRHDLAVSHHGMGGVLQAQGDLAAAQKESRTALAIMREVVVKDPANARWQREMADIQRQLSEVLQAAGDPGGALENARAGFGHLAALLKDPNPDLSQLEKARIQRSIGEALQAQGDLGGAQAADREAVRIMEQLTAKASVEASWRRDLAISYGKTGLALLAAGDAGAARDEIRTGLAILTPLADQEPTNADWQRDLAELHRESGDAAADRAGAGGEYKTCVAIVEPMLARGSTNKRLAELGAYCTTAAARDHGRAEASTASVP